MVFRGQTLGKYRIVEPLGSGGFGTVYLAEDTWIDKRVAIKVPHRQGLDFGELLREPRLLASLNHPNIVTVITAEKQDNVFFIVMEYVQGDTLETIIVQRGALELAQALLYTCQITNAVEHAHKQGVIHRDLRPANVFVATRDSSKSAISGPRGSWDRGAWHDGDRQPAKYGAGTIEAARCSPPTSTRWA
jgi:serine/threonine-protein kinase